ncbi:MAG TPA: hypothetical protein VH040_12905 [Usitatibacter sp.]|jgi:hypothetical protein|nr:hypothetical protein [Usitatibacter sp.]
MEDKANPSTAASDAAQAADLLVKVAAQLNERLALTATELARSQTLLREASGELMTAFRGAADRLVVAQRDAKSGAAPAGGTDYGLVLDHLYNAVQHLQSHDLVNQLIDAQKLRVEKMREKLGEAISLAGPAPQPGEAHQWVERSRAMLDCIVAGIRQMDEDARGPRADKEHAGSVDLF